MPTWLHEADALRSLAETETGPARDWANAILAAVHGRIHHLPVAGEVADPTVAANPEGLHEVVLHALRTERDASVATTAASLGGFGLLPSEAGALIEAARGAQRPSGRDGANLWLAVLLADLGVIEPRDLRLAADATHPQTEFLLPGLVIQTGRNTGSLASAVSGVVDGMAPRLRREPLLLGAVLRALGVPTFRPQKNATDAVRIGFALSGALPPDITPPRGSKRRRTQAWIRLLCADIDHPAAALLQALYERDPHPYLGAAPAAVAAWLYGAHAPGEDPVYDVLNRGIENHGVLTAARSAVVGEDAARIGARVHERPLASVLAVDVLTEPIAAAILQQVGRIDHPQLEMAACVAAARFPDLVPAMLLDPETRTAGLYLAAWTPTEEVLKGLIALQLPTDPQQRINLARALASMGDAAAVAPLIELLRTDEAAHMVWPRMLVRSLLRLDV